MTPRTTALLGAILLVAACADEDPQVASDPAPAPSPTPSPAPTPGTPAATEFQTGQFWDSLREQGFSVSYTGTQTDASGNSSNIESQREFAATDTVQGRWRSRTPLVRRWIRSKTGVTGNLPNDYSYAYDLFDAADGSWHARDLTSFGGYFITTPDAAIPDTMLKGESLAWVQTASYDAAGTVYRRGQRTLELRGSPNSADLALMCDVQDYRTLPGNIIFNWTECFEILPDGTATGYATLAQRVPGTSNGQDTQATNFTIGGVSFDPPADNNVFLPN